MIENLQNELYQLENKQAKGAKLRANITSWRAKNAPKFSSKYLKDRMYKIKHYLNYALMIITQNILAILRTTGIVTISIKLFENKLGNFILDNSKWYKINRYLELSETIFEG